MIGASWSGLSQSQENLIWGFIYLNIADIFWLSNQRELEKSALISIQIKQDKLSPFALPNSHVYYGENPQGPIMRQQNSKLFLL